MKHILALLLVIALVLLCGCAGGAAKPDEPVYDGTEFAPTTVYEDDTLVFRVLSATLTKTGVDYAAELQNKSDETVNVTLSDVTVNGNKTEVTLSSAVEKKATAAVTLSLPLAKGEVAKSVGLHLAAASGERWWMTDLVDRDLMFYPVPQPTATATATATAAA